MTAPATDEHVFSQAFGRREGPYHLYDAGGRPLIRAESGAHVLGALLRNRTRLVFLDDAGCPELSALRIKGRPDRKSTRLNSSHANISYAGFCLKKKTK